jgi:hypothetical protein
MGGAINHLHLSKIERARALDAGHTNCQSLRIGAAMSMGVNKWSWGASRRFMGHPTPYVPCLLVQSVSSVARP